MASKQVINIDCDAHVASYKKEKNYEDPLNLTGFYTFIYEYPLNTVAKFKHKLNTAMSDEDLLLLARKDYEKIYEEEEAAVGNPGHIPGMLNRASSDGPYGIWGHDLGDLYFERININKTTKIVDFDIGS